MIEPRIASKFSLKHDGKITIAVGRSRKETNWKNKEMFWSELVSKLRETKRTDETYEEYKKLSKSDKDEIKDVGGFVGGTLKGGRRKADSIVWRQIITLDADFVKGDLWSAVESIFGYGCVMYSTHSHTPTKPRLRLVIPLKRAVTPDAYQAIARRIAADIGIDFFDDTTYQPHRLMYWPSTSKDGEYVFKYLDEEWLDPDEVLNRYSDWKDSSYWPESSKSTP
jgi:putative DNA primase/helicase